MNMFLIECIKYEFSSTLKKYRYREIHKEHSSIYHIIEYHIEGLVLFIHIELRENYFYIDIEVIKNHLKYSISDRNTNPKMHDEFIDIFDFSSLDKDQFKRENIKLEKRAGRLFGTKAVQKRVVLYAKLIESSMSNILEWASN